eukprot:14272834-Heterocapsa_arctica.AAC.1
MPDIENKKEGEKRLLDDQAAQEEEPLGKRLRSARLAIRRRDAEQEQILEQEEFDARGVRAWSTCADHPGKTSTQALNFQKAKSVWPWTASARP